ncbi:hypothetical protein [Christiangramia fulva]|nr:hypothetical protein [Christiangramia fulva]
MLHRFGYYGLGFFFGIVIVLFFLGGKRASCSYGPNGRVLLQLRSKDRVFSEESLQFFKSQQIDTSVVARIFKNGDVDFGKSEVHKKPCNIYYVSGKPANETIELKVVNCDSIATIEKASIKKDE